MKIEIALTRQLPDLLGQDLGGQRTSGDDGREVRRKVANFLSHQRDGGMTRDGLRDRPCKLLTIHCQRRSRRNAGRIRHAQDERAQTPQFFFQEAGSGVERGRFQRVAAHQLRQPGRLMRRRLTYWPHLIKQDAQPRVAACQAASEPASPPPMMTRSCCFTVVHRSPKRSAEC